MEADPTVASVVTTLLERTLQYPFWSVEVSDGGVVSLSREHAARSITSGEWPRKLGGGAIGANDLSPVWDVNLLVTASELSDGPTGYAIPHVAAVSGGHHLAKLDTTDITARPRAITGPSFSAHVLVHEVGHALGLAHEHGEVYRADDAYVATPMISTYAWNDVYERTRCGDRFPHPALLEDADRKLDFRYGNCAREALRAYRGSHLP